MGRTVNSTKRRKDGSKIKTLYYACGGYVMKGTSVCEKFLLRKAPLEDAILETVQARLQSLVAGEGERLLRQYIEEEIAAQGADPRHEQARLRTRLSEIEEKAGVLLEGMSAETKGFVDAKLRELAGEKRRLNRKLEDLDSMPFEPIDVDAVLRGGLAALNDLPRLLESAELAERKQLVQAFVEGVTVQPDEMRIDLRVRALPVLEGNPSVSVVAGARLAPLQTSLEPLEPIVVPVRAA